MESLPLLRSAAWWPVIPAVEALGLPLERHLAASGVPDDALARPDLLMPERPMWDFFDRLHRTEGVRDIGFRLGSGHHVLDVPGLALPLMKQPNLLNLLRAFCNELRGHASEWNFWLTSAPRGVRFCRRASPIDVGQWPMEQYAIGYMTDLVRMAAGPGWVSDEIWLMADEETARENRQDLGEARLHFGATHTALSIHRELLTRPVNNAMMADPLGATPAMVDLSFPESVRLTLTSYLHFSELGIERFAEIIGLKPRTLQRRLAAHHTTFRELLAQARFERARTLLTDPAISITEVAMEAGYTRLSAFDKQFRKWAGTTPLAYRRSLRPEGSATDH